MKEYTLEFAHGCWQGRETLAPEGSGIYCVYACAGRNVVELLYIGKSLDLRGRLQQHTKDDDYAGELVAGRKIFYAWAELDGRSLVACEEAMVYHFKPRYNDFLKKQFAGNAATTVVCKGPRAYLIKGEFTVYPT